MSVSIPVWDLRFSRRIVLHLLGFDIIQSGRSIKCMQVINGFPPRKLALEHFWEFWWKRWHWKRISHKYFGFSLSVLTVPILHIYSPNIRGWYIGPFAAAVPREPLSSHPVNQDINKHQLFGRSCLFHMSYFVDMRLYLCRNVNPRMTEEWTRCMIINKIKQAYSKQNLSRYHSVHHKSHTDCPSDWPSDTFMPCSASNCLKNDTNTLSKPHRPKHRRKHTLGTWRVTARLTGQSQIVTNAFILPNYITSIFLLICLAWHIKSVLSYTSITSLIRDSTHQIVQLTCDYYFLLKIFFSILLVSDPFGSPLLFSSS